MTLVTPTQAIAGIKLSLVDNARPHALPAHGAITFGELVGQLGRLRIDCPKCGRSGQYRLAVLIAKYGRDQKLSTWIDKLTADCPRRLAKKANDPCDAHCPDLPNRR